MSTKTTADNSVTYESQATIKSSKKSIPEKYKNGPGRFCRDEFGLLNEVSYEFDEDGSVNWRSMIKDEHLFPNKSWFDLRKKDVPRTIDGLKDHQLLIKLSGIKELAKLRGFSDVSYEVVKCEADHVAVICRVTFLPNYETGNKAVTFQDMANATLNNTSSFATKFLETIACNRAFVRCVRNFLNVHIVGDDEIDKSSNSNNSQVNISATLTPYSMIESLAKDKLNCGNFEEFKVVLRDWWSSGKYKNDEVKNWNDYSDIPATQARILMKVING
tara:strand:+ start:243 stop:1064 length:822 start_codon:yes stop_codon:yes gene_type:complete